MSVLSSFAAFVQASLFGGTWDDLAFEIRVLKEEVGGLHQRLDTELSAIRGRLDQLEGKPAPGKGRGRLAVLSGADAADAVVKVEALTSSPAEAVGGALETSPESTFTGELSIGAVLALHPEAGDVLANHHLPSCGSCAVSSHETLADGLANHGVSVDAVLAELNRLAWN